MRLLLLAITIIALARSGLNLRPIIQYAQDHALDTHPFFTESLKATETQRLGALWTYHANMEIVTCHTPDWLSRMIVHSPTIQFKTMVSRILFDELGGGNTTASHCLLIGNLANALSPWKPAGFKVDDPMAPGKRLRRAIHGWASLAGDEYDFAYVFGTVAVEEVYFGHIYDGIGRNMRKQSKVPAVKGGVWEYQLIHEVVEDDHLETAIEALKAIEASMKDKSAALESLREGAIISRRSLLEFLDGVYEVMYNRTVPAYERHTARCEAPATTVKADL